MTISNYYWYFTSALPLKLCDDIIKFSLSKQETMAKIGGYDDKKLSEEQIKNMQIKRKSDLVWLDENWIYRELHPYVHKANELAGWNFEWDFSESCQFPSHDPAVN